LLLDGDEFGYPFGLRAIDDEDFSAHAQDVQRVLQRYHVKHGRPGDEPVLYYKA
jgi:hypothetical protein